MGKSESHFCETSTSLPLIPSCHTPRRSCRGGERHQRSPVTRPGPREVQRSSAPPRPYFPINDSAVAPSGEARNFAMVTRSEEHTSELQSQSNLVCRLLL